MSKEPSVLVIQPPARTEYVDRHVTITEKRAPTDESVKLLREMEQKAEAEVIKSVSVGNSSFECVVHQIMDNMSDKMIWRAVFKLNGKQMAATVETAPRRERQVSQMAAMDEAFAKLRDEMAKVIAGEVLNDAFVATMRQRYL